MVGTTWKTKKMQHVLMNGLNLINRHDVMPAFAVNSIFNNMKIEHYNKKLFQVTMNIFFSAEETTIFLEEI